MKRLLYILFSILPAGMAAQNMYEIAPLMQNDLTGTSRYISMGGSMGALGADISVMGSNPAGIAIYRSSDFSITGSMGFNNVKSTYNGNCVKSDNTNFDVESFGAVLASPVDDFSNLKYLNFGIGYRRKNGLANEFSVAGPTLGYSQQYAIRDLYDRRRFGLDQIGRYDYDKLYNYWLPMLATYANIGDTDGNLITRPDGSLIYEPTDMEFHSEERGGATEVDFNFAANIGDRFYWGATLSLVNVDYTINSLYYEMDDAGDIYSIGNYKHIEGSGYNIKLGAIWRPFRYSPFKVGVAIHTPTWYRLNNCSYADIEGPFGDFYDTRDYDLYNGHLESESKWSSPWRYLASASYTFGTFMALNVDYEYTDYSTAKYKFVGLGSAKGQNEEIAYNLKEQHTVRIGAELNLGGGMTLRGGYLYSTAPFKTDAYKEMLNMQVTETATDYNNRYSKEAVTLGGGYRGKTFYFDMAYVFDTQKSDFYPYYDPQEPNPAARMEYSNHTVTATLGMRF